MVKVKVKQNISNKPKYFLLIFGFAIIMMIFTFGTDKISEVFRNLNGSSNNNSSQIESILSKQENLLTIDGSSYIPRTAKENTRFWVRLKFHLLKREILF